MSTSTSVHSVEAMQVASGERSGSQWITISMAAACHEDGLVELHLYAPPGVDIADVVKKALREFLDVEGTP